MTKTMTEYDYLEDARAILDIINKRTSIQAMSLLTVCLCTAIEGLSTETRRQHRDIIMEGIGSVLDGKPLCELKAND